MGRDTQATVILVQVLANGSGIFDRGVFFCLFVFSAIVTAPAVKFFTLFRLVLSFFPSQIGFSGKWATLIFC